MSMPLLLEWTLVTEGQEVRCVENDNLFSLTLPGYRLYPISETIKINRTQKADFIGTGVIVEISWSNDETNIKYQLLSLDGVN